jgi:hypothetical protein
MRAGVWESAKVKRTKGRRSLALSRWWTRTQGTIRWHGREELLRSGRSKKKVNAAFPWQRRRKWLGKT